MCSPPPCGKHMSSSDPHLAKPLYMVPAPKFELMMAKASGIHTLDFRYTYDAYGNGINNNQF